MPTCAQKIARKTPKTRVWGMYVSEGWSGWLVICGLFSTKVGREPPIVTEIENENGMNDVRTLGVIEVRNVENGLNARGTMQVTRRGTASHNTELSDERADLESVRQLDDQMRYTGSSIPISGLQFPGPARRDLQSLSDTHRRQDRVFFLLSDGQDTGEPPREPRCIRRNGSIRQHHARMKPRRAHLALLANELPRQIEELLSRH